MSSSGFFGGDSSAPSQSPVGDGNINEIREQRREIYNKIEKIKAVAESLVSTDHELQLLTDTLKPSNSSSSSLQEAYDKDRQKNTSELHNQLKALFRQVDTISEDATSIRPHENQLVCCITCLLEQIIIINQDFTN